MSKVLCSVNHCYSKTRVRTSGIRFRTGLKLICAVSFDNITNNIKSSVLLSTQN